LVIVAGGLLAAVSPAPLRAADAPRADLTIYYSQDALGYLESCGCAGPVIGLADLVTEFGDRAAFAAGMKRAYAALQEHLKTHRRTMQGPEQPTPR
jgi:hypothetical protein